MGNKINAKKIKHEHKSLLLELNNEQQIAKKEILRNAISIVLGKAGSGKTLLACYVALELYLDKKVDKIIITRPTISKEEIGFLPGSLEEKMDPWIQPIYANLYQLLPRDTIEKMISDKIIEIVPITYMRGRTFLKSAIIADELQNLENGMFEMVAQRLGIGSVMVFTGDNNQIDLKNKTNSSFYWLDEIEQIEGIYKVILYTNHRHPIVDEILTFFEKKRELMGSNNGNGFQKKGKK